MTVIIQRRILIAIALLPNSTWADSFLANTAPHAPPPEERATLSSSSNNLSASKGPTDDEIDEIWKGVSSSFTFPFQEWEDRELFDGLSGNVGYHQPLAETESANIPAGSTQGPTNLNQTLTLSLKYAIAGAWFVSGTVYHYLDSDQQQAWNPDFTYVFGYSDWRPYTLSLVYSNYGGNRFNPDPGQNRTEFKQGTWSLGWKFPIKSPFVDLFRFTDDGAIGCQIDYNFTPEYFNLATTEYKNNHQTLSLGCKYSIWGNWYVNGTAFYYFDKQQQQPWNPDYTYGFGYFDWRPGTITLQYNNYSGNRWNSSDRGEGTGRFKDGSITLAYSFAF
ncbi:hypothetical protein LZI70_16200 [Vibrio pelagius]|uniref:Uncharacterized protein n=1 Tax=Vibrio pelagius TaxID=28169 RepID=A0ABY5GAH5_VIBPE|nr:hypothetical protein [Vibrio pelagius]UTT86960.1 hypothetical protein LZI70_16200 [Vibrio pelagius]